MNDVAFPSGFVTLGSIVRSSVGIAIVLSGHLSAATLDSLLLPPITAKVVLPRATGKCWTGLTDATLLERVNQAFNATRFLRLDNGATATVRLKVAKADNLCDLTLEFQDEKGQATSRVTLAPEQTIGTSEALERLVSQLSQSLSKQRGGTLELTTTPPGATVTLAGIEVGSSPLVLDGLVPGVVPLTVALPGWKDVADTLHVEAGQNLTVSHPLDRSQSWLDSSRSSNLAARRDSVWNAARSMPAKNLSELFDRLAYPVTAGAGVPVAILPFDVSGAQEVSYNPGLMAAEYGVARWSKDPRFAVVERAAVSKLLSEQALVQSGAATDSGAAQMGRLAAAQFIVTGTVHVMDGKQVLAARMVSVETGEIVSAATMEKPSDEMDAVYRETLNEKGQLSGAMYRSAVGPGWGQFYTGHPVQGALALGAVLGSIGFATWAYLEYADQDDELQKYRKYDPSTLREGDNLDTWNARAETVRKDRNDAATLFGISLGVVGAAWAVNVVDAAILGHIESNRIKAKYFAYVPIPMVRPDGLALAWRF